MYCIIDAAWCLASCSVLFLETSVLQKWLLLYVKAPCMAYNMAWMADQGYYKHGPGFGLLSYYTTVPVPGAHYQRHLPVPRTV
jgi:hypothetical protein